jgi:hypothetical protein
MMANDDFKKKYEHALQEARAGRMPTGSNMSDLMRSAPETFPDGRRYSGVHGGATPAGQAMSDIYDARFTPEELEARRAESRAKHEEYVRLDALKTREEHATECAELWPEGRDLYYEGDDWEGFQKEMKSLAHLGFRTWVNSYPADDKGPAMDVQMVHVPAKFIYDSRRYPLGS